MFGANRAVVLMLNSGFRQNAQSSLHSRSSHWPSKSKRLIFLRLRHLRTGYESDRQDDAGPIVHAPFTLLLFRLCHSTCCTLVLRTLDMQRLAGHLM